MILISRVVLRQSDTGVDVFTNDIPKIFGGVPLPLRKIEITVDRPGSSSTRPAASRGR